MAILRPSSEIYNISWILTGGSNYATILSDESDATLIELPSMVSGEAVVGLPTATDPGIDTGWVLHVRGRHTGTFGTVTLALQEGTTNIDVDNATLTSSFAEHTISLDSVAIATITDFANLRIRIRKEALQSDGDVEVADVWLELPDLVSGSFEITATAPVQAVGRFFDYPFGPRIGRHREGQFQTESFNGTSPTYVQAADPINTPDARGGMLCSFTGDWYPAHRIVWVDGRPYGDDNAPQPAQYIYWPFDF